MLSLRWLNAGWTDSIHSLRLPQTIYSVCLRQTNWDITRCRLIVDIVCLRPRRRTHFFPLAFRALYWRTSDLLRRKNSHACVFFWCWCLDSGIVWWTVFGLIAMYTENRENKCEGDWLAINLEAKPSLDLYVYWEYSKTHKQDIRNPMMFTDIIAISNMYYSMYFVLALALIPNNMAHGNKYLRYVSHIEHEYVY